MSGHTPGKWIARKSKLLNAYAIETDDRRVAVTPYDDRVAISPTGEADARLIAAAPELLAACKEMLASDGLIGNQPSVWQAVQHMRAAIYKAEGRGE
jgi:hypothetical protein